MNVLITGSNGFIGKNLKSNLLARKPEVENIFCFDLGTSDEELLEFCGSVDFVFHLAGVNRPEKIEEFYSGNSDLTQKVLSYLVENGNSCPVLLSSSTQALLDNDYGKSKKQAEDLVFAYAKEHNVSVYVYRLPGVFGKWCRPNYNSVVATFCHNVANGEQLTVNGREIEIKLVYIDDVINDFLVAMEGNKNLNNDRFCKVPITHETTLGELADTIESFKESRKTLLVTDMTDVLKKKLYSTYLSYLPENEFSYIPTMNKDFRGSFTELIRTPDRGQISVNIVKPGIIKGQHWHNTKTEKFIIVSGEGAIRFRKIGSDQRIEYAVDSSQIEIIDIPVGYTHSIENTGETDMVFLIWCNELFDPENPDTFYEEV